MSSSRLTLESTDVPDVIRDTRKGITCLFFPLFNSVKYVPYLKRYVYTIGIFEISFRSVVIIIRINVFNYRTHVANQLFVSFVISIVAVIVDVEIND